MTLGAIAEFLRPLKAAGVTRAAILYVINRVWWEDPDPDGRDAYALDDPKHPDYLENLLDKLPE